MHETWRFLGLWPVTANEGLGKGGTLGVVWSLAGTVVTRHKTIGLHYLAYFYRQELLLPLLTLKMLKHLLRSFRFALVYSSRATSPCMCMDHIRIASL